MEEQESILVRNIEVTAPDGYRGNMLPISFYLPETNPANSIFYEEPIFIADRPYEVVDIAIRYTAVSASGTIGLLIHVKDDSGATRVVLPTPLDTTLPANIVRRGVITSTPANRRLDRDESLRLVTAGVQAGLQNLTVSITLKAI